MSGINFTLVALLVPFAFTTAAVLGASVVHLMNVKHVIFQGLYIRILLVFPLVSVLSIIAAIKYSLSFWMEVIVSLLEGYILLFFVGLFIGWAWRQGDPYKCLIESKWTRYPSKLCFRFGCYKKPFKTPEEAVNFILLCIYQYIVIRPGIALAVAIFYAVEGREPSRWTLFILAVIRVISIAVALLSLGRLYWALKTADLLTGLKGFRKLTIVKFLLTMIVFNSLVLSPLITNEKILVPNFLCSDAELAENKDDCQNALVQWILLLETSVLTFIAVLVFRVHEFFHVPEQYLKPGPWYSVCYRVLLINDVATNLLRAPVDHGNVIPNKEKNLSKLEAGNSPASSEKNSSEEVDISKQQTGELNFS
mmetsp:Transcript_17090/g.20703  ORF Transcript_17090/g.20703 Transcript_17090/m.20703 type:complete len:365 (+) Transcript_17090:48-1142(+)